MANTSAGPIETFVIPAFSSNDFFSSSFNVSTSLSSRADGSPPLMTLLAVCISEHSVLTVLEQATVVGCRAFVNFMNIIGVAANDLMIAESILYKLAQHYKHSDGLTAHVYTQSGYTLCMSYKGMVVKHNITI